MTWSLWDALVHSISFPPATPMTCARIFTAGLGPCSGSFYAFRFTCVRCEWKDARAFDLYNECRCQRDRAPSESASTGLFQSGSVSALAYPIANWLLLHALPSL